MASLAVASLAVASIAVASLAVASLTWLGGGLLLVITITHYRHSPHIVTVIICEFDQFLTDMWLQKFGHI